MTTAGLPRRLSPGRAKETSIARIDIDKATFEQMHHANEMASEQLTQGIAGFTTALVGLEKLLATDYRRSVKIVTP
jgi:transaldolase